MREGCRKGWRLFELVRKYYKMVRKEIERERGGRGEREREEGEKESSSTFNLGN